MPSLWHRRVWVEGREEEQVAARKRRSRRRKKRGRLLSVSGDFERGGVGGWMRVRLVLTFGIKGIIVNKWFYFAVLSNIR